MPGGRLPRIFSDESMAWHGTSWGGVETPSVVGSLMLLDKFVLGWLRSTELVRVV